MGCRVRKTSRVLKPFSEITRNSIILLIFPAYDFRSNFVCFGKENKFTFSAYYVLRTVLKCRDLYSIYERYTIEYSSPDIKYG